jgi:hypothetical protein
MPNTWYQLQQLNKHLLYASSAVTASLLHLDWFLGFFKINAPHCTNTQNCLFPSHFFSFPLSLINSVKLSDRKIQTRSGWYRYLHFLNLELQRTLGQCNHSNHL